MFLVLEKSTLINEVLYKNINKNLNGSNERVGKCKEIKGLHNIDKIINIDQSQLEEHLDQTQQHIQEF